MKVADINKRIEELKHIALSSLGADDETIAQIAVADAPNKQMGDVGFPCFALARTLRKAPPLIAQEVAEALQNALNDDDIIAEVNAVGPYVNLKFDQGKWATVVLSDALTSDAYGSNIVDESAHWMIEFSAPNTNKPQHLGHVRNDLLGAAVSSILSFGGHKVTRVNLINDRGIHICKSMLAYELFGEGETPESSGMKGDHLVGKYYVRFSHELEREYEAWLHSDASDARFQAWVEAQDDVSGSKAELLTTFKKAYSDQYFNHESGLGASAKAMLLKWEAGDAQVVGLWKTMNQWVFAGFDETYQRLGVAFEKVYYESETYLLGKDVVLKGLEDGKFERLEDGAIVCDMSPLGLDTQKVLLRRDGTSVYTTQDLGTALKRFEEFDIDNMVYVVGDEQNYHFQVLFKLLGLLKPELEGHLEHLSYGMVLLPEGKMKSREGKVVDADDLMDGMIELAANAIESRHVELEAADIQNRATAVGLGALKYYILDFNPKTTVHFDPARSIEFEGRTGPYCMYSYARIQSIGRKFDGWPQYDADALGVLGTELEVDLIRELERWPHMVQVAVRLLDPSKLTEQLFRICKAFSTLYNDENHRIKDLEDNTRKTALLLLTQAVGQTLQTGLNVLGIQTLDEM